MEGGRGLKGIINLGNTDFIAVVIQCLSHTKELTFDYFLSGKYMQDINMNNPLSTRGEIVTEYAKLINELWNGVENPITTLDFRVFISFHFYFLV